MRLHARNIAQLRKAKASTAGTYLWSDAEPAGTVPPTVVGVSVFATPQLSMNEVQASPPAVCNAA
jgi:predicted phage gp36 major capsid-like protein